MISTPQFTAFSLEFGRPSTYRSEDKNKMN